MGPLDIKMVSFHFSVAFLDLGPNTEIGFQSVSGLSATVNTEKVTEGGENRFVHELPSGVSFSKLTLKRSLKISSTVTKWCENAIENFEFKPTNLMITLLNEVHLPVYTWQVVDAIPVSWKLSDFNAERSELAIETLELQYRYFRSISLNDLIPSL